MATFAVCPTSVQEASWEAWESRRMGMEDRDAPDQEVLPEDEPMSPVDGYESPRHLCAKLVYNPRGTSSSRADP